MNKKRLGYTVNAVLSSKKHSPFFTKETVLIDGNKRALWSLVEENIVHYSSIIQQQQAKLDGLIGTQSPDSNMSSGSIGSVGRSGSNSNSNNNSGKNKGLAMEEEDPGVDSEDIDRNIKKLVITPTNIRYEYYYSKYSISNSLSYIYVSFSYIPIGLY